MPNASIRRWYLFALLLPTVWKQMTGEKMAGEKGNPGLFTLVSHAGNGFRRNEMRATRLT